MQWLYCFFFLSYYVFIIVFCEWLYKKGLHPEYTRKVAHTASTLSCLLIPVCFTSHRYVLVLGILSFLILYIGYRKQLFSSIDSVNRKTYGSYLLPISFGFVYCVFILLQNKLFFVLPILILGISDPLACVFGKMYKSKIVRFNKTAIGSLAFLISTFIISSWVLMLQMDGFQAVGTALGISIITTVVELFSPKGSDNLTIPLSVVGSLLIFSLTF